MNPKKYLIYNKDSNDHKVGDKFQQDDFNGTIFK
jgi:hypothetical protein